MTTSFIVTAIGAVFVLVAASLVDLRLGMGLFGLMILIIGIFGEFEE